ncbi:MAG TPA: methyltransferase domain-containing protein [Abditibacteriaceae bacterium]|nr:methyltransferase domain-containing protein [Abditibacteriaceae bacterium]
MRLVPRQINHEELLDAGCGSPAEVRRSLYDIRRINTYLGGHPVIVSTTLKLLGAEARRRQRPAHPATVLDVGTGSADIPVRLIRCGAQRGWDLRVIALDNNWRHLQIAREDVSNASYIHLLQGDAFQLPFADDAVDVVIASLFLHHFRPPQIHLLLREFHRVSRVGWVVNDLVRHYVPLLFFRLTVPIFARSYITRHDGTASILRGYTTAEMRRIVTGANLSRVTVRDHFPYRMSIVGERF